MKSGFVFVSAWMALSACGGKAIVPAVYSDRPVASATPSQGAPLPTSLPPPSDAQSASVTTFEQGKTKNGIRVVVVQRNNLPIVDMAVMTDRGYAQQGEGPMKVLAESMILGSKTTPHERFSESRSYFGVYFDTNVLSGATLFTTRTLSPFTGSVFALLAQCIREPELDSDSIAESKTDFAREAVNERKSPPSNVARRLRIDMYGAQHPYSAVVGAETTGGLDKVALQQVYSASFSADHLAVLFVGNTTLAAALVMTERELGAFPKSVLPARPVVDPSVTAATATLIPKVGLAQASMKFGFVGVAASHADYYPLRVLSAYLGGKLNWKLRAGRGATYGASSSFGTRNGPAAFTITANVQNDRLGEALKIVHAEIDKIASDPVDEERLAKARRHVVIADSSLDTSSASEALDELANQIAVTGRPAPTAAELDAVRSIPASELKRVATRYLARSREHVVVEGDPALMGPLEGPVPFTHSND